MPQTRHAPPILIRLFALAMLLLLATLPQAPAPAVFAQEDTVQAPAQITAAVPGFRQAQNVAIISISEMIDSTTEFSVKRRLTAAERGGADAVVIDLDTPGGEVGAVLEICNALKNSSIVNTVAWINPDAYSGGAIIALACREIVVNDPSSMGDALPVVMGPSGMVKATEVMPREKILPPLLAEVVDSARRFNRDEFLVQAFVVDGIELWQIEEVGTDPPKRWCVSETEYRNLFGVEPARGKPALVAATAPLPGTQAESPSEGQAEDQTDTEDTDGDEATDQEASEEPTQGQDDNTIRPTMPTRAPSPSDYQAPTELLQELTQDRTTTNELSLIESDSERPTFDSASDGRYVPVRYVCDGSAPVVLRAQDMTDFGFAAAVVKNDAELTAFFGASNIKRLDRVWSEAFVQFLLNPFVRGGLIAMFFLAMFVEMSSPGAILPGAIAIACIVLAIAPAMLIGMADWWEIAAMGVGIVLILVEAFVIPGFGIFGISGLLMLFGGLVFTFTGPTSGLFPGTAQQNELLQGAVTVMLSLATAGVGMYFAAKHFGQIPIIGKLVLDDTPPDEQSETAELFESIDAPLRPEAGMTGTADGPLRPSGRAEIDGKLVDVVASFGFIETGTPIRVVRADGINVIVEAINPDDTNKQEHQA